MAIARLDEQFTWDRQALQPELRKFTQAVESRLKPLDDKIVNYDVVVGQLTATGLDRVNEILIPAVQSVIDLTDLGFMTAPSTYSVALDTGPATWVIDAGPQRTNFRPTPWVYIQHNEVLGDWAVGRLVAYDHVSGVLELNIEFIPVGADPGPHVNWTLSMSPAATPTLLSEVPTAADLNAKYADVLIKWAATVAAASAAAASAAAAATFDPSFYYTKTAADARYYTQTQADARYYTITVMDAALAGKAASSHTHVAANITDFNAAADARVALSPAFVIGDTLSTIRNPGGNYLAMDGSVQTTASFTALQALLGNTYAQFSVPTLPTVPTGVYHSAVYEPSIPIWVISGANGAAGTIASSTDTTTWTSRDTTATTNWTALATKGSKIMVAAVGGAAKTSTNGTTWTGVTAIGFSADALGTFYGSLLWSGTQWVVFGDGIGAGTNPEIKVSANDGTSWTAKTSALVLATETPADAATNGSGLIVQISSTNVWQHSTDNGNTWARHTGGLWSNVNASLRCINNTFIITAQSTGRCTIYTSTDGVTWTEIFIPASLVPPGGTSTLSQAVLLGYMAPLYVFGSIVGPNSSFETIVTADFKRWRRVPNKLFTAVGARSGAYATDGTTLVYIPYNATILVHKTSYNHTVASQFRLPDDRDAETLVPRWLKAL